MVTISPYHGGDNVTIGQRAADDRLPDEHRRTAARAVVPRARAPSGGAAYCPPMILSFPIDAWLLLLVAVGLGLGLEVAFYLRRRNDRRPDS
jgi:hypothetical protein